MSSLIFLLVLHHVGDVPFQPSWLIESKKEHPFSIFEHAVVWCGVVSVGLIFLGLFSWWKFAFLLVGHFIIDLVKYIVVPKLTGRRDYWWVYIDQCLHYIQVIIVWAI